MSIKQRFEQEPIYLMDGSAFVYRGFYANQSMQRSDGFPTSALFIVARILMRILREEQPKHFAFVLDGHGPNFRHELFPLYKAQRSATPEDLIKQIDPIHRLIKALGLHLEVSDSCEADDCLASLAKRYREERPVILVATDKDLKQCLHDNVMMWDPASRDEKIVTLKSFEEETGLKPTQWPDVQAIIGDSSDNIPGVRGVGPKTAEIAFREGYDAVLAALGYRLRVTEASLRRVTGGTVLTLTFTNDGTAPFYWDWPVNVYVEEADGTTVEAQPLALSLPDLLPGGCQTVKTKLAGVPGRWWEEQDRRITLGIVDPMTGRDAVRFAMQTAQEDGRTVLFAGE